MTRPDITDEESRTPIDLAKKNGHHVIVEYLKSLPQSSDQFGKQFYYMAELTITSDIFRSFKPNLRSKSMLFLCWYST